MLHDNGTRILKFYLHISPEEQLERFKQRLDDPPRHWKISETDYSERELWSDYIEAFEDAMERTSTKHALDLKAIPKPGTRREARDLLPTVPREAHERRHYLKPSIRRRIEHLAPHGLSRHHRSFAKQGRQSARD